jgi:hypothetical protein
VNKEKEEILVGSNDINLFTALSVFIRNTPRCINRIIDAAENKDMSRVEELAAKLSVCSDMAQLAGFVERARDIIVAAREQKPAVVKNLADGLKQAFEQIVSFTGSVTIEQRLELKDASDIRCQGQTTICCQTPCPTQAKLLAPFQLD